MTEEGYENFREELDFVKLHKRIRMHGIGLYYLLKVRERRLVERLASFRPLKLKDNEPSKRSEWDIIENTDVWDRFQFDFFYRF